MTRNQEFEEELCTLINKYSKENGSDTPDWILTEYLINCLDVFDMTVNQRETWYGRTCGGVSITGDTEIILKDPSPPL